MTMPNRERATILKKEMDALYQESYDLQIKAGKLSDARFTTLGKIIMEEKLLAKCTWQLNNLITHSMMLEAVGTSDDFPEVVALLQPDYHDNFRLSSLEDGLWLHFSDGDMTLDLNRDTAKEMIQALGITIDLTNLRTKATELERDWLSTLDLITLMEGLTSDE